MFCARIVTTVAISTFVEGMLNPARVILAGIIISIRASLNGSVVGEDEVGLPVGLGVGVDEMLGLVLGLSLVTEGPRETLGESDGKTLGLAEGGSIA
jgi:hypothetical protein